MILSLNDTPAELSDEDWTYYLRRTNIPKGYWKADINSLEGEVRAKTEAYLAKMHEALRDGWGMMFYGDFRTGKSSVAAIIGRRMLAHGAGVYFIEASDLMDVVLGRPKPMFEDDETVEHRLYDCNLLILDDLGREHSKEFGESLVEKVLRKRLVDNRSTIITTNLDANALKQKYGESTFRVIATKRVAVHVSNPKWYARDRDAAKTYLEEK